MYSCNNIFIIINCNQQLLPILKAIRNLLISNNNKIINHFSIIDINSDTESDRNDCLER